MTMISLEKVRLAAIHHGCGGIICHGNHTVSLMDTQGREDGHCMIRRDLKTGLCSLDDLKEALGY